MCGVIGVASGSKFSDVGMMDRRVQSHQYGIRIKVFPTRTDDRVTRLCVVSNGYVINHLLFFLLHHYHLSSSSSIIIFYSLHINIIISSFVLIIIFFTSLSIRIFNKCQNCCNSYYYLNHCLIIAITTLKLL